MLKTNFTNLNFCCFCRIFPEHCAGGRIDDKTMKILQTKLEWLFIICYLTCYLSKLGCVCGKCNGFVLGHWYQSSDLEWLTAGPGPVNVWSSKHKRICAELTAHVKVFPQISFHQMSLFTILHYRVIVLLALKF